MNKEHIIQEIRRTAEANNGTPLGKDRFLAETGIKQTDFLGKFWARWSDAIREAGYEPNKLQSAYEDDFLLEHLAKLIQKLQRFPVNGEIRLESRSNPEFPTHNTFTRFGSKSERVRRTLEYCQTKPAFSDVAAICTVLLEQQTVDDEPEVELPSDDEIKEGYVYLIKSAGYYKVGRTNSKERRVRELAIQLPEKSETVHVIATDDAAGIEAYWHNRFSDRRMNGEWFGLSAQDIKAFKRRKFM